MTSRTGDKAYKPFGKNGIVFPLRNQKGQIVSLYFRSTVATDGRSRHFYLKNRQGLYPKYPKPETKKLILTEAIIDAATLIQQEAITKDFGILSLYGTNGLMDEHLAAIKGLKDLQEIVFFFDGDPGGRGANKKYAAILVDECPSVQISQVLTPDNEDVNSLLDGHTHSVLYELLNNRQELGKIQVESALIFSLKLAAR